MTFKPSPLGSNRLIRLVASRSDVIAIALMLAAFGTYWLSAVLAGHTQSPESAYFNDLADAFLHGQLYLSNPTATRDLTQFNGNWYVPFPPLPALLLLPWVAVSGVSQVNTVLFVAMMGAFNVALAFLLLQALTRRGWTQLFTTDNVWLTILFGAGSVQWYMATQATVWFISQICTVTFMLAAAWFAVARRSALLAGTALALAMLAHPKVALFYPFLAGIRLELIKAEHLPQQLRPWLGWCALTALPMIVSVVLLLGYNYARFQSFTDFGYTRANVAPQVAGDLMVYGQFNVHYIPHNLWAMLLSGPTWNAREQSISPNPDGMSLLLVTPALIYLVRARKRSPLAIGAWAAVVLMVIILLLQHRLGAIWLSVQSGFHDACSGFAGDWCRPTRQLPDAVLDHHERACQSLGRLVVQYVFKYATAAFLTRSIFPENKWFPEVCCVSSAAYYARIRTSL
jgi:hypothetical protein